MLKNNRNLVNVLLFVLGAFIVGLICVFVLKPPYQDIGSLILVVGYLLLVFWRVALSWRAKKKS